MKKSSLIFIFLLVCILVFILGVQQGKRVNVTNEALSILQRITPSSSPTITPENIAYEQYTNNLCNISFLYPRTLHLQESSEGKITISSEKHALLSILCPDQKGSAEPSKQNVATRSVELKQFTVIGTTIQDGGSTYIQFSRKHPYSNRTVSITVQDNLLPLIEQTLNFLRPS